MSIFGKSDAELISETRTMIDALNKHENDSGDYPMGLGETFIDEITASREKAIAYKAEKDKLKADLTAKTMQLDIEVKRMKKLYAEAKERIKEDCPQEKWIEFGVDDKK